MSSWPTVRLGEVVVAAFRSEMPIPGKTYRQIGVRLWGEGAYERECVDGSGTKYGELFRVEANDIIVNKIWARNGSVAVVPEDLAGCYGSGEFPIFTPRTSRLDSRWMHWLSKSPDFWTQCDEKSRGTSGKNRIKPEQFLRVEIPLPPLSEQRRIVARIEELAANIAAAQRLRAEAQEDAEALMISLHVHLSGERTRKLGDVLRLDEDVARILATESYPQVGVRSFGGGLFPKGAVAGTETTYRGFNRLYAGALVLSQAKGWEGALAICPEELQGWYVSPEYRTFRCKESEAIPAYLAPIVRSEWFWSRLGSATRGVGARRERTRPEEFLNVEIPMPCIEKQEVGVRVFADMAHVVRLCAETTPELAALMPAILDRAFKGEL